MNGRVAFLVGTGGGAYDGLAEALAAHADARVGQNCHVLTSLAYLGYYDKVDKAPDDHILAAEAQRLFVDQLPRKEGDYIDACRAYCDSLYGQALAGSGRGLFVDATPSYMAILPFLRKTLPDAPCVVVARHPLDMLADGLSPAEVIRGVRGAAGLVSSGGQVLLVREMDWLADADSVFEAVCRFLHLVGERSRLASIEPRGDGPCGAQELARVQRVVRRLTAEELAAYGYTLEEVWNPFDVALGRPVPRVAPSRVQGARRQTVERLRRLARRPGPLNRLLCKARLASDVLLRQ